MPAATVVTATAAAAMHRSRKKSVPPMPIRSAPSQRLRRQKSRSAPTSVLSSRSCAPNEQRAPGPDAARPRLLTRSYRREHPPRAAEGALCRAIRGDRLQHSQARLARAPSAWAASARAATQVEPGHVAAGAAGAGRRSAVAHHPKATALMVLYRHACCEEGHPYGLGRLPTPEPIRELMPRMSDVLPSERPAHTKRFYQISGGILDQDGKPECIGYGGHAWLHNAPNRSQDTRSPTDLYTLAQEHDQWAGRPHEGSTVHALVDGLQSIGLIRVDAVPLWASDVETLVKWLLQEESDGMGGTVIMGTDWTHDMFSPAPSGIVRPTGEFAGGHCYLCLGVDLDMQLLQLQQSWGLGWGGVQRPD